MIQSVASSLYAAAAAWRRRWYAEHPGCVRALRRPVISIGNLTTGGSGKTPVVAHLARLLLEHGERPSILTRGYARQSLRDGVTVVSDGSRVLTQVDAAGDEPLMLARALPGVPVLVGANRFLAGRLAEERFDATVHLLDDGFQHLGLARDVDLLLVDPRDLDDRVVPAGSLREPVAAAVAADAVLALPSTDHDDDGIAADPSSLARALRVGAAFSVVRRIEHVPSDLGAVPVLAVAGIARPERFFADLAAAGWSVAGTLAFRDHHVFTARDVAGITGRARSIGAELIVTTDKDAVRFEICDISGLRLRAVSLTVGVEPAAAFGDWLRQRLHAVRDTPRTPVARVSAAAITDRAPGTTQRALRAALSAP